MDYVLSKGSGGSKDVEMVGVGGGSVTLGMAETCSVVVEVVKSPLSSLYVQRVTIFGNYIRNEVDCQSRSFSSNIK